MKLNIKGLVFVGFAAAVFASAANAAGENDSKTVTSKTYVDTEVAKKVTKNADITAGTATKITYDAKGLVTAGAGLAASDIPDISAKYQVKTERVTNLDTPNDTTYPTTKAVKDAIDGVTNGSVYQAKSVAAEKQYVANGTGGWEALSTDAAPTANSTKPVQSGGVATALAGKQDAALVTSLSNADDTHYPSAKAVADAIDVVAGDIPTVGDGTLSISVGGGTPVEFSADEEHGSTKTVALGSAAALNSASSVTENGTGLPTAGAVYSFVTTNAAPATAEQNVQANWAETDQTSDAYIQNKPTALSQFTDDLGDQKTANLSASITTDSGSTIKYPSVAAVEAYVGTQTGAVLPTPAQNTCTAEAPCALVRAGNSITWEPIQQ